MITHRRLKIKRYNVSIPDYLQNEFINLVLADYNQRKAMLLEAKALAFSKTHSIIYLDYLRTLYSPVILAQLALIETLDTSKLTFRDTEVKAFLDFAWLLIRISKVPYRMVEQHESDWETTFFRGSILFNTEVWVHPADPRFQD